MFNMDPGGGAPLQAAGLPRLIVISLAAAATISGINTSKPWAPPRASAQRSTHEVEKLTLPPRSQPSGAPHPPSGESLAGSERRAAPGVFQDSLFENSWETIGRALMYGSSFDGVSHLVSINRAAASGGARRAPGGGGGGGGAASPEIPFVSTRSRV